MFDVWKSHSWLKKWGKNAEKDALIWAIFQLVKKIVIFLKSGLAPLAGWGYTVFFPSFNLFLKINQAILAGVVELVDTRDLKSLDHYDRAGSSPAARTIHPFEFVVLFLLILHVS